MKTNELFLLRDIAGEKILVPVGAATKELNGMIQLSETAAFIWSNIDTSANLNEVVDRLTAEYDIDRKTAFGDVLKFAKEFSEKGLIKDVPELVQETH